MKTFFILSHQLNQFLTSTEYYNVKTGITTIIWTTSFTEDVVRFSGPTRRRYSWNGIRDRISYLLQIAYFYIAQPDALYVDIEFLRSPSPEEAARLMARLKKDQAALIQAFLTDSPKFPGQLAIYLSFVKNLKDNYFLETYPGVPRYLHSFRRGGMFALIKGSLPLVRPSNQTYVNAQLPLTQGGRLVLRAVYHDRPGTQARPKPFNRLYPFKFRGGKVKY